MVNAFEVARSHEKPFKGLSARNIFAKNYKMLGSLRQAANGNSEQVTKQSMGRTFNSTSLIFINFYLGALLLRKLFRFRSASTLTISHGAHYGDAFIPIHAVYLTNEDKRLRNPLKF